MNLAVRAEYWENEERRMIAEAQRANAMGKLGAGAEYGDMATQAGIRARSERRNWVLQTIDATIEGWRAVAQAGAGTATCGMSIPQVRALIHELEEIRAYCMSKL